ncbi:MAG: hypothetical protein IT214_01170 [Chitinophagaceae bacterium]|jgi:hypothetical protein|nr:hypothetical protein [Chitinophagaceae bacterium]OQY94625.1 MAG: hypothetical protein B6D37_08105 [Sphingobacteriales bacterium UTBCD1]
MKKILLASLCFTVMAARAQTVDEVIQKYSSAVGGLNAFNAVKTLKMTGNVSMQGLSLPLTVRIINGKAMRTDVEVMGKTVINAYKDGKGWAVNPMAGATTATEVTGAELNDWRDESIIGGPLMDYKALGDQAELEGQEDVEGVKCYKIRLTRKEDGKVSTYFISTSDNLLVKMVQAKEMMGQQLNLESFFSDYKDFNGLKFSMSIMLKIEDQVFQETKLSDISMNVPIDDKIFEMPK